METRSGRAGRRSAAWSLEHDRCLNAYEILSVRKKSFYNNELSV